MFRWSNTYYTALFVLQMLADCLLECHRNGLRAGTPLQLRVFVSGRGRLEDVGAAALAETFKVSKESRSHIHKRENQSCSLESHTIESLI